MKKWLSMLCLVSLSALAEGPKMPDSFKDVVNSVEVEKDKVEVTFKQRAAFYEIPANAPDREKMLETLKKALASKQPVQVDVDLNGAVILKVR